MGSFSNYLENKGLNHVFHGDTYPTPDKYIALSTADPAEDGSGLAEPPGNGYARVQVTAWDEATAGATANTNDIEFPQATASWGTITHFAIMDALTSGNMLAHGQLTQSKAVGDGDTVKFAAGDLDVTLD